MAGPAIPDGPGAERAGAPTRREIVASAFGGAAPTDRATRAQLKSDLVRGLYRQAPGLLLLEVVLAAFIAAVFWRIAPPPQVLTWAALVASTALARWILIRRYFAHERAPQEARRWAAAFVAGAFGAGALWGAGAAGFYAPGDAVPLIVLMLLVTGLSAAAVAGYSAHPASFHAFVLPCALPLAARLVAEGTPSHIFVAALLAVWVAVFVYLAHALHGHWTERVLLLIGNARLADTLARARDAADLANRAKSRFLANMSHELRTPLNAIIGFSDIMRGNLFGPLGGPKYQQYVEDIHRSGAHLLRLINDLLDLAKIETGHQSMEEKPVDLAGALAQLAQLMEAPATKAGVALSLSLPPHLPDLRADPTRLRQIVLNLLSNAIKFTRSGGTVALSAACAPDGRLRIAVADTGIGMRPEDIPRALAPFVQLEAAPPRGDAGTGLGLALVKTLIEAHGGTIEIDSAPGRGTTCAVFFPAARVLAADAKRAA
jgi:signal transduction histidine kinase